MTGPGPEVCDLFAVPGPGVPLEGGQGRSVLAGDLVLSPDRDEATASWLNPALARLAAELDHALPRSLRIAMPIPTRDLRWVVDGWGATRHEPGARPCADLAVILATGRLLHAHLARTVPTRPAGVDVRDDRWARAARDAFDRGRAHGILGKELGREWREVDLGPDQLVHGDLAGNVLIDREGLPVVIDVAPHWRPVLWAEAVVVLDAVLWHDADPAEMGQWRAGRERQAMLRAAAFRMLSDPEPDLARYRRLLRSG